MEIRCDKCGKLLGEIKCERGKITISIKKDTRILTYLNQHDCGLVFTCSCGSQQTISMKEYKPYIKVLAVSFLKLYLESLSPLSLEYWKTLLKLIKIKYFL